MPTGLHRYQPEGDDHFLTFSYFHRASYRNKPAARNLLLTSLESTRMNYQFEVMCCVVMSEHVHLLLSRPPPSRSRRRSSPHPQSLL